MYLCHLNVLLEPDSTVIGAAILCDSKVICNCDTGYVICPPLRTVFGGVCVIPSFFMQSKKDVSCVHKTRYHFTLQSKDCISACLTMKTVSRNMIRVNLV